MLCFFGTGIKAQLVPAGVNNIPFLMTFGPQSDPSWGDDDFSQTFFFLIPKDFTSPIFIRVFDPDVGGEVDELNGTFDTRMTYFVYGGKGCHSHPDSKNPNPEGEYKAGNLLATKSFGVNPRYDQNWYTFGPFNPTEGELIEEFNSYAFKIIVDGEAGDDGNLYRFFLSTAHDQNKAVEGGNAMAYEYSFRMHDDPNQVSHIYPFVNDKTTSVKIMNFDWDNDGFIRTVSVARRGQMTKISGDNVWVEDEFKIFEEEKNTSLDIQFIKKKSPPVKNNNVVVNVQNQYGEMLRFYVLPLGGVPKYNYKIGTKRIN